MDIVIGGISSIDPSGRKATGTLGSSVEAKLLHSRPPRKRRGKPPGGQSERRTARNNLDPASGRVMTLLIPEGNRVPRDVESGNYRILVRFVPR